MPDDTAVAADGSNVVSLADRLKAVRADRGISQSQAARELDVARTAYRLWEMEAARPAPDRWRLLARWLGVSMSTLLLAEGLISQEERTASDAARDRCEAATGDSVDAVSGASQGTFFEQAKEFIDSSLAKGLLTPDEARDFGAMFERIKDASARSESLEPDPDEEPTEA